MLESVERGIERALLHRDGATGDLLESEQHAVAVDLAKRNRLEDDHVQGAGEQLGGLAHSSFSYAVYENDRVTLLSCPGE